jgi:predicted RNA-binding Zn ribbon-like protein
MVDMEQEVTRLPTRLGGRLCVDFVNTVDPRDPPGHDYLPDYMTLIDWAAATEAIDRDVIDRAGAAACVAMESAVEAHREAISLRETLYRVLRASAERRPPDEADAGELCVATADLQQRRLLRTAGTRWHWVWSTDDSVRMPNWIILADAVDLLTGIDQAHLRTCAGDGCGWLFVDSSKNHSRRWCSMRGCGNRSKTQRHYQRRRVARGSAEDPAAHGGFQY